MIEQIDAMLAQARAELSAAQSEAQVEAARVRFLGKSGSLSGLRKSLGKVAAEDRPGWASWSPTPSRSSKGSWSRRARTSHARRWKRT